MGLSYTLDNLFIFEKLLMKFNSTVALTLILLVMMIGAGSVSALWGFTLGHEALDGVTQPDTNPTKKLAGNQPTTDKHKGLIILSERDILVQVYDQIYGKGQKDKTVAQEKKQSSEDQKPQESFIKSPDEQKSSSAAKFPIKGQDQGVTLEVVEVSQQGGSLLLDVNLKNDGRKAVRFLYSFLDVRDDQGRALSAITDGLPGELPANGDIFSGTVRIPTALLDDAKKISLTLTDYPDQKLQLKLSQIPVVN